MLIAAAIAAAAATRRSISNNRENESLCAVGQHIPRKAGIVRLGSTLTCRQGMRSMRVPGRCLQVRAAFYRYLPAVGPSLAGQGLVAIIHPFLDRMMQGPEDAGERPHPQMERFYVS